MGSPSQGATLSGGSAGRTTGDRSGQQTQWSEPPAGDAGAGASPATVGELVGRATHAAQDLLDPLKERAMSLADEQKAGGAERLDGVARAVNAAADEIARDMPEAAGYVREMAGGIERMSDSLRRRSLEDMLRDADAFVRSQPLAFFGACVAAGFVMSRFLRVSAEGTTPEAERPSGSAGDGADPGAPEGGSEALRQEYGYGA